MYLKYGISCSFMQRYCDCHDYSIHTERNSMEIFDMGLDKSPSEASCFLFDAIQRLSARAAILLFAGQRYMFIYNLCIHFDRYTIIYKGIDKIHAKFSRGAGRGSCTVSSRNSLGAFVPTDGSMCWRSVSVARCILRKFCEIHRATVCRDVECPLTLGSW